MKNPNEIPSGAEFGQLISFMAQNGMTATAARAVIGDNPNDRIRAQITQELIYWQKTLPKAEV